MPLWQVIQIVKLYLMWDRAVIIHPIHAKNLYTSRFAKNIPPPCPLQPADTKYAFRDTISPHALNEVVT